jgi:aryl carrier-like protein
MCPRSTLQISLHDDRHMQSRGKLLVQDLDVIDAGCDSLRHPRLAHQLRRARVDVQFVTIFATRAAALVRTSIRKLQRGIRAHRRNHVQAASAHHLEGRTISKMTIQRQIRQRDQTGKQLALSLEHRLNPLQLRRQGDLHRRRICAAVWPSWLAFGRLVLGLLSGGLRFGGSLLHRRAHDLLPTDRQGAPGCGADARQAKERDAGDHPLVDAGKAAVETVRLLASFGDDDRITSEDVDVVGLDEMLAREQPAHLGPGDGGGEEALHSTGARTVVTPASDSSHGDTAGHGQEGPDDAAHLANGRRGQRWLEPLEQC